MIRKDLFKRLKLTGAATGLAICLLSTNLIGTYGLSESAAEATESTEDADLNANATPNIDEESGDTTNSSTSGSGNSLSDPGSGDTGNGDSSTDNGNGDSSTDNGNGDGSTDPGNGDGSTDPGNGDGSTDPGNGDGSTDPGNGDGSTNTGNGGGSTDNGSGNGTTGNGSGSNGGNTPAPAPQPVPQPIPQPAPDFSISIPGVSNGNMIDFFDPSANFLDPREKVKYNVDTAIEGMPLFITQEMIVGALKCQDEYGYPASVTIAQIIQESGFGTYGPNGENGQGLSYLAFQYNNLFGIKGRGTAGSVNMRTGEMTPTGESYMTTAGFRAYYTYTECLEDRAELLKDVYSDLTDGVNNANEFAWNIGRRWATDIHYAQSLIKQMKTYDLYRLDAMTLQDYNDLTGKFANPCPGGTVTSDFGYRTFDNSFHRGLDLGTGNTNIPTYAADAGTVIIAGYSSSAGNWIVIDHGNGLVTKYMHHEAIYVKVGQHVEKGQQIGLSGTTGYSTGNHLHFQVEKNGIAVNPAPYLGL